MVLMEEGTHKNAGEATGKRVLNLTSVNSTCCIFISTRYEGDE